jgi:acyl-CoA synthetase (AMP-forming)/AMP-acid ligase II
MTQGRHILELLGAAQRGQDQVRFVTPRGVHETSFADLWQLSSRVARAFETSIPAGRVAGILTPSAEMVACFVGCLRAGRDFVSLPLPGRGQNAAAYLQQLRTVTELSHVTAVVVESANGDLLQSLPAALGCPLIVAERFAEDATGVSRTDRDPGELIQFSSGTTGTPKGVRLSGTAIAACVESLLAALRIGDKPEVFCGWVPLSHDMGLIGGLLTTWVGATRTRYRYICVSPELFVARPSLWLQSCAEHGATITTAPTFAYQVASSHLARGPTLDLTHLRAAILGAEPIGSDSLHAFASAASRHGMRETALCPAYGLAEATLAVSMVPPEEPWTTRTVLVDGQAKAYVSCGRILGCVSVEAPEIDAGAGPIRIAGPAVCNGYIPPRDAPADGWLDTGDLGVLAEGELVVTGRSDDLLCVAGRKLFAWELERAANTLPQVMAGDCVVVTDGRGRYVALFEPRNTGADDLAHALSEVRRGLAAVAGIGPSAVGCLPRGTLPKTPSGKIRRNGIAASLSSFVGSCLAYKEF